MLVATFSFSALVTQPFFGALADRIGYRRIAVLGVIFNAILFNKTSRRTRNALTACSTTSEQI